MDEENELTKGGVYAVILDMSSESQNWLWHFMEFII